MYITSVSLTISLPTTGKTHGVPPGLERRHLDLPPGIAKKIDAGSQAAYRNPSTLPGRGAVRP